MEPISTHLLVAITIAVIQSSPAMLSSILPTSGKSIRVGRVDDGPVAEPTQDGDLWRCGRCQIEAPLPNGYPAPTPPGAIEVKAYPSVRRAEISASGNPAMGMMTSFWPLFNHIQSREIAMTSPVEMNYSGMVDAESKQINDKGGSWTMSFLYRKNDLGPTGKDGVVTVVDTVPILVISVGMKGAYGMKRTNEGLTILNEWLTAHPAWRAIGDPRAFSYNGPAIRNGDKWSEVQLPVELVGVVR